VNYDITVSISQGEKWRVRRTALWRIQFRGGSFLRPSRADRLQTKSPRSWTRFRGEEEVLASFVTSGNDERSSL